MLFAEGTRVAGRGAAWIAVALAAAAALLPGCRKGAADGTPAGRPDAARALASDASPSSARALIRALGDADPKVRQAALLGLSDHTTAAHRPAIEQATQDRHPGVRAGAATTLSLYKDEAAAHRLAELLSGDVDQQVRLASASGLGLTDSQKAIVALLDCAEKDGEPRVQVQALKTLLRKLGLRLYRKVDPQDRPQWRALIEEMKHDKVVQAAYRACGATLTHHPEDKTPEAPGHQP